jgi:hypothetical protein
MRWLLKRWWFWAGAGFMLVAVAAGYLLIPVDEGRISQASCDRIQLETSYLQMMELLGDGRVVGWTSEKTDMFWQTIWYDEDFNAIQGDFLNGRLTGKRFTPSPHSFLELTKRRIARRIRALWP